jgi:hypothetical protein
MNDSETATLQQVFSAFNRGALEMDGRTFAKMVSDCGLLDKKMTSTDVDLIFAKIKAKTARKINFVEFEEGVRLIATKKGVASDDVVKKIISTGAPKFHGTKPEFVKFHDDKSTYTGMYSKGTKN